MNDVLIFLSFAAFVLSPCFIALRSRDQREEAKLGPRLVPARGARMARISNAPGKKQRLIVDSLAISRNANRAETPRGAAPRHSGPRASYAPSHAQAPVRHRKDASLFIPPARQVPALGYTAAPVPALVYGLPHTSPDELLLLVLPGGRAQQRALRSF